MSMIQQTVRLMVEQLLDVHKRCVLAVNACQHAETAGLRVSILEQRYQTADVAEQMFEAAKELFIVTISSQISGAYQQIAKAVEGRDG